MEPKRGEVGWLFLDLNSYFASVEQQLRPALRGRPVAVLPLMSDKTSVIAASYEAKAHGVRTGTPVWEAKDRCPDLVCLPARHEKYLLFQRRILAEIERHLPVHKEHSIDEVACKLIGRERAVEEARRLAGRIKAGLAENVGRQIRASIGLGPNVFLAKVATELQKPDGLVAIRAEDLPGPLLRLDLADLPGIGANMLRRLNAAGVADIAGLWALSPDAMRAIWGGVVGQRFWAALHGIDLPERLEEPRRTLGHSQVLAPEARPIHEARLVARRLLVKAGTRLRRTDHLAGGLALAARFERSHGGWGDRAPGRGRSAAGWGGQQRFRPTADSFTFLRVFDQLWDDMRRDCPTRTELRKVAVTLYDLIHEERHVPDLLDDHETARRELLCRTMDYLNKRYGRDTVRLGPPPAELADYTGVKIAFTRVPDEEEFLE